MRRPSFQFYPADWLSNKNLKRCTHAEKGMLLDVLCLMHDSDEYGILRWTMVEIARAIAADSAAFELLHRKNVLKGCDNGLCKPLIYIPRSGRRDGPPVILVPEQLGPIWFSSRMVEDEYKRNRREENLPHSPLPRNGASPLHSPLPRNGASPLHSPLASPLPRNGAHLSEEEEEERKKDATKQESLRTTPRGKRKLKIDETGEVIE